jgi:hypothetical protein
MATLAMPRTACRLMAASLALTVPACGVGFETAAELEGLRVIGVQKSAPYARPGDTIDLRMLYHDDVEEERPVQVLWLRGCQNPPRDLVQLCTEVFREAVKQADVPPPPRGEPTEEELGALIESLSDVFGSEQLLGDAASDTEGSASQLEGIPGLGTFAFGFGDSFQFTVAEDVITSRPPPMDPKVPPYGVEFVFSIACAGQLWLDSEAKGFPVRCYDEDGVLVPPDRYEVGYTKLWIYDEIENANPLITGIEVKGERLADDDVCIDEECLPLSPADDEGVECPRARTLKTCADEDNLGACPKLPFRVLVDQSRIDQDGVLSLLEGAPVNEQMWVNYYTDDGKFASDVVLVNDSVAGFHEDNGTKFFSPEKEGLSHVWAVVHDNRGGVSWARFEVCIED